MKNLLTLLLLTSFVLPAAAEDSVLFNRDIRPILASKCFNCHGPDKTHREAELRLDEEDGIETAFGGKLAKSEAWERINSKDDDIRMPPPKSHKQLTADEIELLSKWIESGASWEGHWAFTPPVKPPVPAPKTDKGRIVNPIDAFILQRLVREGMQMSPEADRSILLRRVTFDLTGLPPTIAEIDAFLNDKSPKAYENAVDRLLKSERFGERMALMWMDASRYGDTSVFHADGPRDMWPWRDWVIDAYNSNKPFNDFTVEQLAGDLLPNSTIQQKIATAFNRNNGTSDEGGAIPEELRVEYAVDRVKTTSMVWMGLTVECAQCHNHKYDPITQKEYYQFYAYFNQASDPGMQTRGGNQAPVVNVPKRGSKEIAAIEAQLATAKQNLGQYGTKSEKDFVAWLKSVESSDKPVNPLPANVSSYFPLDETDAKQTADSADSKRKGTVHGNVKWAAGKFGQAFQCDGGNFIDLGDIGDFERTDKFSYGIWVKPEGGGNGAPVARMDDGASFRGYDLYIVGGTVAVHIINKWQDNAIKVTTKTKLKPNQWQHVFATYDGSSKAAGIKIYFDGKSQPWAVNADALTGSIRTKKPLYIGRRNPGSPFKGLVDDLRVYNRELTGSEVGALAGSDPIGPILAIAADKRTDQQKNTLKQHYLNNIDKGYRELNKQVSALNGQIAALAKPVSTVMVMQDVPKPRMTYILDRGNYASPKKDSPVEPGVISALPALPEGAPANRLGLAQWLTAPDHPLTARVTINRYWYMLFGTGIVETVEDFGSQGEWPSHPDLLDWMATDFVENGWDIKRTLKQMVMSATYRQSSRQSAGLVERDPANLLLSRGPRFRLQGEFIRDNALSASGLMVNTVGGPSVKPYQPPGLWGELVIGGARFRQDKGDGLYRRSMYTYWKRSACAPSLTIFDTPTREKCTLRRSRTNTPLQALVTMNDPQFVEASRALAERAMKEGGDSVDKQIEYAFRLVTGTRPNKFTMSILKESYDEELKVFSEDVERAKSIVAIGDSKRDETIDAAKHAAFSIVTQIILNLDQTLTRG
jgi:hypothetical protein